MAILNLDKAKVLIPLLTLKCFWHKAYNLVLEHLTFIKKQEHLFAIARIFP